VLEAYDHADLPTLEHAFADDLWHIEGSAPTGRSAELERYAVASAGLHT
jgi:hypothetical protein